MRLYRANTNVELMRSFRLHFSSNPLSALQILQSLISLAVVPLFNSQTLRELLPCVSLAILIQNQQQSPFVVSSNDYLHHATSNFNSNCAHACYFDRVCLLFVNLPTLTLFLTPTPLPTPTLTPIPIPTALFPVSADTVALLTTLSELPYCFTVFTECPLSADAISKYYVYLTAEASSRSSSQGG